MKSLTAALLILLLVSVAAAATTVRTFVTYEQNRRTVTKIKSDGTPAKSFGKMKEDPAIMWSRTSQFGVYDSAKICQVGRRVAGATDQIYTPEYPDDAELVPFESSTADWVQSGPNFVISTAKKAGVIVGASFDDFNTALTIYKWSVGNSKPDWTYQFEFAILAEGGIAISDDGKQVGILVNEIEFLNPNNTDLFVFDAAKGTITSSKKGMSGGRHLVSNADGSIYAFHLGLSVFVYEVKTQKVRMSQYLGYSDYNLALSSDGTYLVIGFTTLDVYKWNGLVYTQQWSTRIPSFYVNSALLADNNNIAVAWTAYNALQPIAAMYNVESSTPLFVANGAISDQLQNPAWAVSVTNDGQYLILGSWGNNTEAMPTVNVYSVKSGATPIWSYSTVGSVFDVDIATDDKDPSILNIAIGTKNGHANIPGRGGNLIYAKLNTKKLAHEEASMTLKRRS